MNTADVIGMFFFWIGATLLWALRYSPLGYKFQSEDKKWKRKNVFVELFFGVLYSVVFTLVINLFLPSTEEDGVSSSLGESMENFLIWLVLFGPGIVNFCLALQHNFKIEKKEYCCREAEQQIEKIQQSNEKQRLRIQESMQREEALIRQLQQKTVEFAFSTRLKAFLSEVDGDVGHFYEHVIVNSVKNTIDGLNMEISQEHRRRTEYSEIVNKNTELLNEQNRILQSYQ